MFEGTLSSVLIVENESGDVYIVEDKSKKPKRSEKKSEPKTLTSKTKRRKKHEERELEELEVLSPAYIKKEIKDEPNESDDCDFYQSNTSDNYEVAPIFVDPDNSFEDVKIKIEPEIKIEKTDTSRTFDGNWSDDANNDDDIESNDDFEFDFPSTDKVKKKRKKERPPDVRSKITLGKHKFRNLRGRPACRYCDTVFATKDEKNMHFCKYLQCDPKNFICRFCNKELSRKTFSNHVHEALSCQYCGRKILNPRNMKLHIAKKHKNEKYVPPKERNIDDYLKEKEAEEEEILLRLEEMPSKSSSDQPRKIYPRKKRLRRFECDLCGKYLVCLRNMRLHMNMHLGIALHICPTCGENFYTSNGIKNHSCARKQKRPEKDFRIHDLRRCRYCNQKFSSLDENNAHKCPNAHPTDPKLVICRSCGKAISRSTFNRHMEFHSGIDWICRICDRKVATKRALKIHMTLHSGDKPYKCNICSESFINKAVLDYHMRYHGINQKIFRCEFCFRELCTEFSLRNHIQRVHKKTSHCELCKVEFSSREILKDHIVSSHEPSICRICGKSFSLPRYLKMHEKLHYNDDSKVTCPVCSKNLSQKKIKPHVYRFHPDFFDEWIKTHNDA